MIPKRTLGLWLFVVLVLPLVAWWWMGAKARERQLGLDRPLWAAVEKNDRPVVEAALQRGADAGARRNFPFFMRYYSDSLIGMAVRKSSPEIVEVLLKKGS